MQQHGQVLFQSLQLDTRGGQCKVGSWRSIHEKRYCQSNNISGHPSKGLPDLNIIMDVAADLDAMMAAADKELAELMKA